MGIYLNKLIDNYWKYVNKSPIIFPEYLDRTDNKSKRPPVFIRSEAWRNIILSKDYPEFEKSRLLELIPRSEWHRWYGSMNSSQALAQSVLGNLFICNKLTALSDLRDDDDLELINHDLVKLENFKMEMKMKHFGEPRQTSIDAFFYGDYQIAIECKMTEPEVGTCSRPRLTIKDTNYNEDYCNGNYCVQNGRTTECSLTERKISYWKYLQEIFKWNPKIDHFPCPVKNTYQLVRNILAAIVRPNGEVSRNKGHVILIYDERNPAFQKNGKGYKEYYNTKMALRNDNLIRKCSWQRIMKKLNQKNELMWLCNEIDKKYGIK